MRKADFTSVDEYISAQPETAQVVLQPVRSTIRKALPGAEEVMSYKIPAYRLHGGIVLYSAGWKEYYSLYPDRGLWSVSAAIRRLWESGRQGAYSQEHHRSALCGKPLQTELGVPRGFEYC